MKQKIIRILLIEDKTDDTHLVREILCHADDSRASFEVKSVSSLSEGIDRILQKDVDLVILDLSLPDSLGMETLVRLEPYTHTVPIVVITEINNEALALEALSRGVQDYLAKDQVNLPMLSRTIRYAIERQQVRDKMESISDELRRTNGRLERLVQLDPLTELLNRRGMQEALSLQARWARRGETDLMALLLDIDNFKTINDTLGHAVGDVILKEISKKLKASMRTTDYLGRIGGDEFLILMPKTRQAEGMMVAEKIRLMISEISIPVSTLDQKNFRITASAGLVMVSNDLVSIDELVAKSHLTLFKSKHGGKNKVSLENTCDESFGPGENRLSSIIASLRRGDCYRVVKQPIFDLFDLSKVGYEFLSRMNVDGFEMPDDFFRVCLENNILTLVDHQCFKNCVASSMFLSNEMRFHLNLFPSTLLDIPIKNLLESFPMDVPRNAYCVEISEQQIIGDPAYLINAVRAFKKSGIQIAIDDVGFGRSCLESLILLEPDVVKIDRRWVHGIAKNSASAKSLARILKVATVLGCEVVAEGIELQEDLEFLKSLGIRYGQGYLLGRPA